MILDTNALFALAAKDPALLRKLAPATHVAITLISLGEYHFGLLGIVSYSGFFSHRSRGLGELKPLILILHSTWQPTAKNSPP